MNNEPPVAISSGHDPSIWTLRDYFAAAALSGILVTSVSPFRDFSFVAQHCFLMADAMLKERENHEDKS